MPVMIHTNFVMNEKNDDKIFAILLRVSEMRSGLYFSVENNHLVVIIDDNLYEHSVMKNLDALKPELEKLLSPLGISVSSLTRMAFLPRNSTSFFSLLEQRFMTHSLFPIYSQRLQNISTRYNYYTQHAKQAKMKSSLQQRRFNPSDDDEDQLRIQQQNDQIMFDSETEWDNKITQQLANIARENTLVNAWRFQQHCNRHNIHEMDPAEIFSGEKFNPHATKPTTSSLVTILDEKADSVLLQFSWVARSLTAFEVLSEDILTDAQLLMSIIKNNGFGSALTYKRNPRCDSFSIEINGLSVTERSREQFLKNVKYWLFLSGISDGCWLSSATFSFNPTRAAAKSVAVAAVSPAAASAPAVSSSAPTALSPTASSSAPAVLSPVVATSAPAALTPTAVTPATQTDKTQLLEDVTVGFFRSIGIETAGFWKTKSNKSADKRYATLPGKAIPHGYELSIKLAEAGFKPSLKILPNKEGAEMSVVLSPKKM